MPEATGIIPEIQQDLDKVVSKIDEQLKLEWLPPSPLVGPPLPRMLGITWEHKIAKRYDAHDIAFYVGTGVVAGILLLLLPKP